MGFERLASGLNERVQAGYFRQRRCVEYEKDAIVCVDGQHYLNFASNDYLGLRQHPKVLQAWVEGLALYGGGSGASPLVTGYSRAHEALENYLAERLGREAVLLFNSGFAANQALCQALFDVPGTILADKLMHASFLDGAMASQAQLRRFRHNDISHLASLLHGRDETDCLVASEGVFSMDGDSPPIDALVALCEQQQAWLMLDDAHGFGVLGETGLGTVEAHDLSQQQVPILMGTFGKAVGTAGAFVAGSRTLIEHLINHARHYIYSTAQPPAQAVATLIALEQIAQGEEREKLESNIRHFRQLASRSGLTLTDSQSAIQPVILGDPHIALSVSDGLKQRGIWAPAIRYPTVPKNTDRLRVTLSASHTERDIQALVDGLALALEALPACS